MSFSICFSSLAFPKLKNFAKGADKTAQELVKDYRKKYKDSLSKIKDEYFLLSPEEIVRSISATAPSMEELVYTVKCFRLSLARLPLKPYYQFMKLISNLVQINNRL